MQFDLLVKATTPGQPRVIVAVAVSATDAAELVSRLAAVDLLVDASIVMHDIKRDVADSNVQHLEVLTAVLEQRERSAAGTEERN